MPASEAQIRANQANALKSSGPKTEDGKARSRANSYKHGLTGEGIVMPEEDAAEVERLARAFLDELKPTGEAGRVLTRRMALLAVRMDRASRQEVAATSERVRRALDEFEAPEGVDAEAAGRLRDEAGRIALFDPSKGATLARKYEAAAERGFFRALKELRQLDREAKKAADPVSDLRPVREAGRQALGSSLRVEKQAADLGIRLPQPTPYAPPKLPDSFLPADFPTLERRVDVPISIGRRR